MTEETNKYADMDAGFLAQLMKKKVGVLATAINHAIPEDMQTSLDDLGMVYEALEEQVDGQIRQLNRINGFVEDGYED